MSDDSRLIRQFKQGSSTALRRIYETYRDDLLRIAVCLVGDIHTAEDIVQDVFIQFARSGSTVKVHGNLRAFLATCTANRARNVLRDKGIHAVPSANETLDNESKQADPGQWAILSEQLQCLCQAMAQIPAEQREVISLHVYGQMTFHRIAKQLGLSSNTVQGRYRYGMEKLRILLNSEVDQ